MDINGWWYGGYAYSGAKIAGMNIDQFPPGSRFRATLVCDASGRVTGSVVDDDVYQMQAVLDGSFDGQVLQFVKSYVGGIGPNGTRANPIKYVGTLSPDGTMLSGAWIIEAKLLLIFPVSTSGVWQAQRYAG